MTFKPHLDSWAHVGHIVQQLDLRMYFLVVPESVAFYQQQVQSVLSSCKQDNLGLISDYKSELRQS
uniref:Uncharacterized protein n=1 Tax=Arion vulgaris TaxID=1028688 RepID=A0A0B7AYK4_9EUPU